MNPLLSQVKIRILVLAGVCLLFAVALGWRFYHVQITRHAELLQKAKKGYTARRTEIKQRGKIYDADGYLLVGNLPKVYVSCSPYSVVIEPFAHMEKSLRPGVRERVPALRKRRRHMVSLPLARHFGGSAQEHYAALEPIVPCKDIHGKPLLDKEGKVTTRRNQHYVVIKAADPSAVKDFKADMKKADLHLGGFAFSNIFARHYPKGRMLANVIGYANTGKDVNAELGGLELTIGKQLRAEPGQAVYQHARGGSTLAYGDSKVLAEGYDGDDVYLTIKEPVQSILEEELDAAFAEHSVDAVYAVIVDPRTGNILAMSQRPNFDPDDTKTLDNSNMSNKIAVNAYEPGSVMKPFAVAKALDSGIITPETIVDCGSSPKWSYGGHSLHDPRGYGEMTPGGVLKKSSNIGTGKIALMMGDELVYNMLKTFKFGTRTRLPFASESPGILPRYPFPDKVTVTRAPIGYTVQVTALQLARGYCALANGGMMPALRLLDRRRKSSTGEFIEYPYAKMENIFTNPSTASAIVEMLVSVTAPDGTGKRAAIEGYEVAGKTGTAQKLVFDPVAKKRRYGNKYCASFCGFVPARNPALVMVISFDGVTGAVHGGGGVAAPVFKKTLSRVLRLLNVPPDFPEKLEKNAKRQFQN
ncbi:MAG: penicillin-binding protein 2 [Lentisphaeria bacterium]|nr:penicillin-binding protein 2 [Lentisphaeria bacterium]